MLLKDATAQRRSAATDFSQIAVTQSRACSDSFGYKKPTLTRGDVSWLADLLTDAQIVTIKRSVRRGLHYA